MIQASSRHRASSQRTVPRVSMPSVSPRTLLLPGAGDRREALTLQTPLTHTDPSHITSSKGLAAYPQHISQPSKSSQPCLRLPSLLLSAPPRPVADPNPPPLQTHGAMPIRPALHKISTCSPLLPEPGSSPAETTQSKAGHQSHCQPMATILPPHMLQTPYK